MCHSGPEVIVIESSSVVWPGAMKNSSHVPENNECRRLGGGGVPETGPLFVNTVVGIQTTVSKP